jgi:hypothetical protein
MKCYDSKHTAYTDVKSPFSALAFLQRDSLGALTQAEEDVAPTVKSVRPVTHMLMWKRCEGNTVHFICLSRITRNHKEPSLRNRDSNPVYVVR